MPRLGETVNDGTVTKWFKQVGDAVKKGETLFEVSTDKVDSEIPSPADGVVTAIYVKEGETVDVGTTLAVIGDADSKPSETRVETAPPSRESPATASAASPGGTPSAALSPVVRRLLVEHHLDASQVTGTGPQGRLTRDDVLTFVASRPEPPSDERAVPLSPVVRRLLNDGNLDPSTITGSGPDGRLTRRDVEVALAAQHSMTSGVGDEVIPFTRIRRLTAEHMVRSKATSAHTLMVKEVDYENIERVRRLHGAGFKKQEGFSLTYLAFNAVATLIALRDFPHLNASVGDDELIVHHELNLGIAVDLDGEGLIVPVIRKADGYDLRGMSRKIHQVAGDARSKKLSVDDTSQGTFTISNPGPYATLLTGAIINQPQVAILSTDGVTRKPVVVEADGEEMVAIHSMGHLALTFDHRAVDGAYAARFLTRIAAILTGRDWAAEL
jgi:2-oxoglutarate dehydrogenase E2 component (dihydrolipoamide succinyltransferase)